MSSSNDSDLPMLESKDDFEFGKFVLSNLAAKRSKQLKDGAPPLIRIQSSHPLTVALAEITAGKIRPVFEPSVPVEQTEGAGSQEIERSGLGSEFGFLLPALEESEPLFEAHLDDEDVEVQELSSIEDLLEKEELGEPVGLENPENLISLSDIAEEESKESE